MKHLLTLAALAAGLASTAQAQITIAPAQFTATAATVERFQRAAVAGLTTPVLGPNRAWDYRHPHAAGSRAHE